MKLHKLCRALCVTTAAACTAPGTAVAQGQPGVYGCDLNLAQQPMLQVTDNATPKGALITNVQLITLPNGMKAVTFSARYAERLNNSGALLKVRYSVSWSDDCGRPLNAGANVMQGFVLNAGQYRTEQSTAFTRDASRAYLNIYIESKPTPEPYPQ